MTRLGRFLALAAIVAGSLALRSVDLGADPPGQFAEGSQDFTTDGAYLTLHARSAVLFDQADPFGYHHWASFKYTIVSAVSWGLFSLGGVSLRTANLTGVVLQMVGILLILVAVGRELSFRTRLIVALLLGSNFVLWVYARVPFSENALLAVTGGILSIYTYWFEHAWAKVALGLLVAAGLLFGKLFGGLLIVPLLASVLLFERKRWWQGFLLIIGPALALVVVVSWFLHDNRGLFGFLWEHAAGAHGFPHGFESPKAYVESLVSFGRTGLHRYTPVLSLGAAAALLLLIVRPQGLGWRSRVGTFAVLWIIVWMVCLAPFNYRPLRYMYVLIVPLTLVLGLVLDRLPALSAQRRREPLSWWQLPLVILLFWYAGFYLVIHPFVTAIDTATYHRLVWYVLPFAAGAGVIAFLLLRGTHVRIGPRAAFVAAALVVLGVLATDAWQFGRWWQQRTYSIRDSGQDLRDLTGPDAVLAGQYGPALALESGHRAFPLFLSDSVPEWTTLLRAYPVTHLAIGSDQWQKLVKSTPELSRARLLVNYWMRDNLVSLVRVAGLYTSSGGYQPGDFEHGIEQLVGGQLSGAEQSFQEVLTHNPVHKSTLLERFFLLAASDRLNECRAIIDTLRESYRRDFTVAILGAVYYKWLASQENSDLLRTTADELRDRAIRLYPANRDTFEHLYQTMGPTQLTTLPR